MPGYVMHLAEVDMVLGMLRESRDLSDQWVQRFVTGNLLPDTKLLKEKYISLVAQLVKNLWKTWV